MGITALPNNISELKNIIKSQHQELTNKEQELTEKDSTIEILKFQLAKALQARFGRKSEKIDDKQLSLFDEADVEDMQKELDKEDEAITVASYTKKKPGRKPLPKELPREQRIYDLTNEEKICKCGNCLEKFGEDKYEQLEYVPAEIKVIENIKYKYVCKKCEGNIKIAEMPKQPIPKSVATPSLLAHTLISKFENHLPLYRQEKIWQSFDIDLPRCTLSNWVLKIGELFEPFVAIMKKYVVNSDYVQADESPFQVLNKKDKLATSNSYIWLYGTGPPFKEVVVYEYQPNRKGENATNFLLGFIGYLQTDGFPGYNEVHSQEDVIHVACMAHVRRHFMDIVKASKKDGKAKIAINFIQKLYKIEKQIKDFNAKEKQQMRQEKAKPILDRFKNWLDELLPSCPPKGPLGKAISYALKYWDALNVYVTNGHLNIDNNKIENKVRPFALGRKNWLFAGNEKGAKAAANIYSIIQTAKANGLHTYNYLRFILTKLPNVKNEEELEKLLPHICKPEDIKF